MRTFTDTANRTWTIRLTLGTAMQVRDKLGIDLLAPEAGDPPLLTRLASDEMLLGEVLCALIEDQFEKYNLTAEDVKFAFDGNTLMAAQRAFYEELIDFFQNRGRADRAKAVMAQMRLIETAAKLIEQKIDAIDIERLIDGAISTESQELSQSTQKT